MISLRLRAGAIAAIGVAAALTAARAQTNVPASPTRPNFSGTWSLDRGISDDPSRALDGHPEAAGRSGPPGGRGAVDGLRGRGGYGGFGRPDGFDRAAPETRRSPAAEERARMRELLTLVRDASASLVISHNDPTIAITDAQGHTQLFQTTGGRDQHHLRSVTIPSTTRWDGPQLVTEYTVSGGQRLIYTYTLVPHTKQMVVRIRLEGRPGARGALPPVKLVYRFVK